MQKINNQKFKTMRKITFLILMISLVILCPTKSNAQMQSAMVTSTQRVITPTPPQTRIIPIKSVTITPTKILSAVNYMYQSNIGIAFYLTDNDSNASAFFPNCGTKVSYLQRFEVMDMDIYNNDVFFCGRKNDTAFFAYSSWMNLITGGSINIIYFPQKEVRTCNKIDVYTNKYGDLKVSLIGEDPSLLSLFIDFNLSSMQCDKYYRGRKLLEVRHTANNVVLLGEVGNGSFTLISHDKNNLQNYVGHRYQTPYLYVDSQGKYSYLLEILNENGADIAIVGYTINDSVYGTTISTVDLNSMNVLENQTVLNSTVNSQLKDMKMDYENKNLLCLIKNPITGSKHNIFALQPLSGSGYQTDVVIPNPFPREDFRSISTYDYKDSPCYMVLGHINNNHILLFDKKQYDFKNLNCSDYDKFKVEIIKPVKMLEKVDYEYICPIHFTTSIITVPLSQSQYSIICK